MSSNNAKKPSVQKKEGTKKKSVTFAPTPQPKSWEEVFTRKPEATS